MEAERRQEEIREKNRLKELKEQEREAKRKMMLDQKHADQEMKKAEDEEEGSCCSEGGRPARVHQERGC